MPEYGRFKTDENRGAEYDDSLHGNQRLRRSRIQHGLFRLVILGSLLVAVGMVASQGRGGIKLLWNAMLEQVSGSDTPVELASAAVQPLQPKLKRSKNQLNHAQSLAAEKPSTLGALSPLAQARPNNALGPMENFYSELAFAAPTPSAPIPLAEPILEETQPIKPKTQPRPKKSKPIRKTVRRQNFPQLLVHHTTWHPRNNTQRRAMVQLPDATQPVEVLEGQWIDSVQVIEIQPTAVVFQKNGESFRRAIR